MAQLLRGAAIVCVALLVVACCGEQDTEQHSHTVAESSFEEVDASVVAHTKAKGKKAWDPFKKNASVLKPFGRGTKKAKAFKALGKNPHSYQATGRSSYVASITRTAGRDGPGPFVSTDARTGASGHYYLGNNRRRIGAGFGRRRRSKAARCVTFKTWRHFRKHKMIASLMKKAPKKACNKKELTNKIVKHKKERSHKKKQEVRGKELAQKHVAARKFRKKAAGKCKMTNGHRNKAVRAMKRAMQKVAAAKSAAKRLCDAQKRANEKARKEKKLLQIKGPTFKFKPSQPCKGGLGTFTKPLIKDKRVNVGVVPTGMANVKIELETKKDLDAEIWTKDSKTAIIAWKCALHNNNHLKTNVKNMCIDSADKITKKWRGNKLQYSGWLGKKWKLGRKFGHEEIKVLGKSNMPFMMKTYAYEAGIARVKYSWGVDRARCQAHKAMKRKERKAKFDAKQAAKKALKEKDYKAVLKVLYASVRSCSGAKRLTKKAWKDLARAKLAASQLKKAVAACTLNVHHARSKLAVACLKDKCPVAVRSCKQSRKCSPMMKCLNACPASKRRSASKKCASHCLIPHAKQKIVKRVGRCGRQAKCWSTAAKKKVAKKHKKKHKKHTHKKKHNKCHRRCLKWAVRREEYSQYSEEYMFVQVMHHVNRPVARYCAKWSQCKKASPKKKKAAKKKKKAASPEVYQHCNFGGYRKVLRHSTSWVRKLGIKNDDLSSVKVPKGKCVVLYQHAHYKGKSWKICGKSEVKCFVHHKMSGRTSWNDQVSSIKVINARSAALPASIIPPNQAKRGRKKKKKTKKACRSVWKCLPGISTPVRLDAKTGHVSCMSSQGKHCWWGKCRGSKVPRHPKNIGRTSLICGAHHKKKWGGTGYNHKGHWCNKAKKGLGFTGKPCHKFTPGWPRAD